MPLPALKMIDIPPVWLLAFVVLVAVLDRVLPMPTGSGFITAFGTGLVVGSVVLIGLAAWEFRRHRTTIIPHLTAGALITTGPFARSRNPIYLADALILAGLCLRWDVLPGLVLVPVFIWIIQTRFILGEEARLRGSFGAAFDSYASKVRRWA